MRCARGVRLRASRARENGGRRPVSSVAFDTVRLINGRAPFFRRLYPPKKVFTYLFYTLYTHKKINNNQLNGENPTRYPLITSNNMS